MRTEWGGCSKASCGAPAEMVGRAGVVVKMTSTQPEVVKRLLIYLNFWGELIMSFSFTFTYDDSLSTSFQGQLSSSYTTQLTNYLKADGADYVAFLAYVANGGDVDAAKALKAEVEAGHFTLSDLFSAAQSKTGEVDGEAITNPEPKLTVTVGGTSITVDLTAMLGALDTETWESIVKAGKTTSTIYHTREFYTEGGEPEDYVADWADPQTNEAPTAEPITWSVTEYDEKAVANSDPVTQTINLLTDANASDSDGDVLSVVNGSVTLANGDALPSYMSVDYTAGTLTIDTNAAELDGLYDGATWNFDIKYQITDGVNAPIENTVALTVTGTADQFHEDATITITKIGDAAYTTSGSYELLGSDWSNVSVDVTGNGDYDFKNEDFAVTGDVSASYAGVNEGGRGGIGNAEDQFISVNPTETLAANWSDDGALDYSVSFSGPVDGYTDTDTDTDASTVSIAISYDYWM